MSLPTAAPSAVALTEEVRVEEVGEDRASWRVANMTKARMGGRAPPEAHWLPTSTSTVLPTCVDIATSMPSTPP